MSVSVCRIGESLAGHGLVESICRSSESLIGSLTYLSLSAEAASSWLIPNLSEPLCRSCVTPSWHSGLLFAEAVSPLLAL